MALHSHWAKEMVRNHAFRVSLTKKRSRDDNHGDTNSDGAASGNACSQDARRRRIHRSCASTPAAAVPPAMLLAASADKTSLSADVLSTEITRHQHGSFSIPTGSAGRQHQDDPSPNRRFPQSPPFQRAVSAPEQQSCVGIVSKCSSTRLSWADYFRSKERLGIAVLSAEPLQTQGAAIRCDEACNVRTATSMEGWACWGKPLGARAIIPDLNLPACEADGLTCCPAVGFTHARHFSDTTPSRSSGVHTAELRGTKLGELHLIEPVEAAAAAAATKETAPAKAAAGEARAARTTALPVE
ncbi:hypothetical protein CLOP_g15733 [Closterium sp. NIES-67]|nr:hypothetical protein CLOP_g15733 [Closterium sp. NIES-67]